MKFRKLTALLMSSALLLGCLAGCANDGKNPGSSENNPDVKEKVPSKYAFKTDYIPVQTPDGNGFAYINNFGVIGNQVYLSGEYSTDPEPLLDENGEPVLDEAGQPLEIQNYEQGMFRMNMVDGKTVKLNFESAEIPEGMYGDSYIQAMKATPNGTIRVIEEVNTYRLNLPEGVAEGSEESWQYYEAGENLTMVSEYDAEGNQLNEVRLEVPEESYIHQYCFDSKGNIYGYNGENLFVFDATGKLNKTFPMEMSNGLVQTGVDQIGAVFYQEDKQILKLLDPATMDWGKEIELPAMVTNIYPGFAPYEYLYDIGDTVFGHKSGEAEDERLFSWLEANLDVTELNPDQIAFLDDGRIVTMEGIYHENGNEGSLLILNPVDPEEVPEKEEIVLGCIYLGYELRKNVVNFNRTHDNVRIVIRDYAETAQDGNNEDALRTMNTEILSGKGPDIISVSGMSLDRYIAKGLLMDLWPMIDADPDIDRENLMEHFFDVMSTDGKLYTIAGSFNIQTAACKKSIVGDRTSWTLDEMLQALQTLEPGATVFSVETTKSQMLYQCLGFNLDSYIDWNTGTCNFDSPEFISLLKFAGNFHEEIDWEHYDWENQEGEFTRINSGKQLMSMTYISDFTEVQIRNALHGGEVRFIGMPSNTGNGSCFYPGTLLAISASCKNPELAWSFAREILLEENQQNHMFGFPTNKAAFDQMAREAMTPVYQTDPETGEQVEVSHGGVGFGDDFMVDLYAVTQQEYDALMELYENCNAVFMQNQEIADLINEEAKAYFAGQKTAEETAKLIQDRVGLFIMEQG